ncbi:uncharacterized protein LOC124454596 [Xenia sp. Carnegie-2017]|uniref:uncharacterized protein LOC124454596 n=1 Tax=Xenia sp. Carnegie-2017 TaxID=2897299 RepID=UPI001F035A70|nr:uncharacterized protein LOC124454596 [Xenia sp. Carnegie-2017]
MSSIECEITSLNTLNESELDASSARNKKIMKQTNAFRLREEEVICGWKFKMQFLGCSEDLKLGGTDHELANLIHDIHALYKEKNANIRKAPSVIVTVNTQCINISGNDEDDVLYTFPLVYIKDVTTGVDIAPYSRTCVLVAKEHSKLKYRAFVLFSKSSARAAEFIVLQPAPFILVSNAWRIAASVRFQLPKRRWAVRP